MYACVGSIFYAVKKQRERERSRREIRQQKFCVKKSKQITKKARKEQ